AFRLWSALETSLGSDYRYSDARVAGARNTLTKIWNLARFISRFPQVKTVRLRPADQWILAELAHLTKRCLEGYKEFNFFIPATELRDFLWGSFASHYLELAKTRAYGIGFTKAGQRAAWSTLHECIRSLSLGKIAKPCAGVFFPVSLEIRIVVEAFESSAVAVCEVVRV